MTAHLSEEAVRGPRSLRVVKPLTAREYLRVSKDRTNKGRSTGEQHVENVREVEDLGWTMVGEPYCDNDRSASRFATKPRDDYQRLVRDLEEDAFGADVLVLWETSRGSRDMDDWVPLLSLLERRGVLVHITSHEQTYDPRKPRDRETLLLEGVSNESDSRRTSVRTKRDARALAEDGKPTGRCPWGYMREYDPRTGDLLRQVPDPEQAPIVLEVFERIAQGHSLRSIARDLEEAGVVNASGKPFGPAHLRTMALTHAYAGLRVHVPGRKGRNASDHIPEDNIRPAVWKEIVPRDLFWRVQSILRDPARRTARPGRANHLLTMIATCGVCKGPMIGRTQLRSGGVRDGKRDVLLACKNGGHVRVMEEDLDRYVEQNILAYLTREDLGDEIAAREADGAALRAAREEVGMLTARRDRLTKRLEDEDDTEDILTALRGVKAKLAAAEQRVSVLSTPDQLRGLIEPGPGADLRWQAAPLEVRRQVARLLLTPDTLGVVRVLPTPKPGRLRAPMSERVYFDPEE